MIHEEYFVPIIPNRGWGGLPESSKVMYKERYFQPDEDYEVWLDRVCRIYTDNREHRGRMKQYIRNYWFHPATPISANAGLPKQGFPVSCFVQSVGDSKDEIFSAWEETFYLGSKGAGIGAYWGGVRSAGEKVGNKGKSSGVIPFLKVDESLTLAVSQGGLRRASKAVYLPVWHPEIEEFVSLKDPSGDPARRTPQLFTAVVVDDKFLEAVEKRQQYALISPKTGEVLKKIDAYDLWVKILEQRMIRGVPYILYLDNVNKQIPIEYEKEGMFVETSNLCVAPETKILTNEGYKTICELEGKFVKVWNGQEWSEVEIFKTGENQKLIKVETNVGVIECTPYHKFYIKEGGSRYGKIIEKRAYELNVGDKLIKFDLPIIYGHKTLDLAYENGFYSGDGCEYYKTRKMIYLYGKKISLLNNFKGYYRVNVEDNRIILWYKDKVLKNKYFVPNATYTIKSRIDWLAGVIDSDGAVVKNGDTQSIQISSINYDFLYEILLMLQTLGVISKINKLKRNGKYLLPKNDGSGELGFYNCKDVYRLLIGESGIQKLLSLGLKTYRIKLKIRQPNRNAEQYIKVLLISDEGRYDDTYCFTEPKRHMGMFNGLLTGQCGEIMLHTQPDYSNICVLSSINLEYYDEFSQNKVLYKQFLEDVHRFLDNVLSDFIKNAKNEKGFEKVVRAGEFERSIGVGVMGLHYLFQKRGIAFDSYAAKLLNEKIFKEMKEIFDDTNKKLANEKGACPLSKKYGTNKRNTHVTAVAPTASIGILCNHTSPGIEPLVSNIYVHKTNVGNFTIKNRYLQKLLQEKGKDIDEVWAQILADGGSVQNLDFLTDKEKDVFKTAFEINQQAIIELAGDRQKYIDQGQSVNLFILPGVDAKFLYDLHMLAWVKNLKSLYYIRSDAPSKVEKLSDFKSAKEINLNKENTKQSIEECYWCG